MASTRKPKNRRRQSIQILGFTVYRNEALFWTSGALMGIVAKDLILSLLSGLLSAFK
jgi:hypothetical protein